MYDVAFFSESDVVDDMQHDAGAARLRSRCGGGRQATDAASDDDDGASVPRITPAMCMSPMSTRIRQRL